MQFDRPAPPGDQFQPEHHVGALLVIEVLEHVPPMLTKVSEKPQDAIRANVYVVGPPGVVTAEFQNTLLWPRIIVSRLRQSIGRTVLGVLTGQPNVKRDGKNVPYDLDDPAPAMEQAAVAAMTQRQMQAPAQQPAQQWGQQPAAPAQAPWGQQQPAQQPGGWQQPPAQQGPPPGYGQPAAAPAQQGPPPGWGQQPATQPPATGQPGPWGQTAAPEQQWGQQQLPAEQPPADVPPWEQQAATPPWGGQQ
jgi:hypothetical protein